VEAASVDWGLTGKAVIVTGASSGIGASTARALGAAGASVLLVGRDVNRLAEQARAVQAAGGRAEVASIDLDDIDATGDLPERAVSAFGSLHGIVHTASRFDPLPLAVTSLETVEQQWRTNVAAPLMLTKAALPHLVAGSSVVFIGSTTGTMGFPGCSAYTATKGAVDSLTRALAVELAPSGIRVNLVVPGYVRTPMLQPHLDANEGYEQWILERTPMGRIGGPDEVAPSILFMLSPLSQYVDGATLVADGGWIAQ
jgi:NAD(P)-dependent dehydrogenase (short-subunit alcohol dehydrogenase family)